MAKTNNLTDFLTDVANAIREKEGSSGVINPQAFSSRILALQTGGSGGGGLVPAKDVNFRDYDGTILHSYSKSAFLAISEMPPLPSQDGLICQGWNWNMDNAKSYVEEYGVLEVGATYITDDGKTRYYIRIVDERRSKFPLQFNISASNSLTIDWGDGNTESVSTSGTKTLYHQYDAIGDYIIQMDVTSGAVLKLGETAWSAKHYANLIKKVELGRDVAIGNYAYQYCYSLTTITLPVGVTSIASMAFQYCSSLVAAILPINVKGIGQSAFNYCYSLKSISIPSGVALINNYTFGSCASLPLLVLPSGVHTLGQNACQGCYSIDTLILPNALTKVSSSAFSNCFSLMKMILPNKVTTLEGSTFNNNYSLTSVIIPKGVTNIAGSTFYGCSGLALVDFRNHTSVPSLGNTNAFTSVPSDLKIVVPDELYDEWVVATNWSSTSVAKYIVKASEYNG